MPPGKIDNKTRKAKDGWELGRYSEEGVDKKWKHMLEDDKMDRSDRSDQVLGLFDNLGLPPQEGILTSGMTIMAWGLADLERCMQLPLNVQTKCST